MKYYVVADIHGYYELLIAALNKNGFFTEKEPHKLVICGDLFDRGEEACKLQDFTLELMKNNQIILIRGNHEDLMLDMIKTWESHSYLYSQHISNGTVSTALQLTGESEENLRKNPKSVFDKLIKAPFIKNIIPAMLDYYETDNYIFVHGWIPCRLFRVNRSAFRYERMSNWREANSSDWNAARWTNGMDAAHDGIIEDKKTIVCGHWHCSFGHNRFENRGSEFGNDADFSPYYDKGIIAIDACTTVSHTVNCVVIND